MSQRGLVLLLVILGLTAVSGVAWAFVSHSANISKENGYAVLRLPNGKALISKENGYAVLRLPNGKALISKMNAYAVLMPPNPTVRIIQ